MGLKEFEHEGDEDFLEDDFPNRDKSRRITSRELTDKEANKEAELVKKQIEYMSIDNPLLWDGEI